jgi:adenosylcobinamide amidohydrolase
MLLRQFNNGDELHRRTQALIVTFSAPRDVLSTSPFNGGFRNNLKSAFNHDCKEDGNKHTPLKAPTYEEHMKLVAADLGLDPLYSCGLSTAADMENVSIQAETYEDLTVTAVVTGGIDVNGGRVGDPSQWHEANGVSIPVTGTINIMLFIDAKLPEGTLTRALVTCTEAKTAALQELLAPSLYSSGIATGSGTDGTIIVSNPRSPVYLTYAGKHSKLGELIGRTVMKAVKDALFLQTGLSPAQQFDIFSRIGRYSITRQSILDMSPRADINKLDALSKQNDLVVMTSLYVHLLDQLQWGLISPEDTLTAAEKLLRDMGMDAALLGCSENASAKDMLPMLYKMGLIKASLK